MAAMRKHLNISNIIFFLVQILLPLVEGEETKTSAHKSLPINPKLHQSLLANDIELLDKEMNQTKQAIELYSKKLDALVKYQQERSMQEPIVCSSEYLADYLSDSRILQVVSRQIVARVQAVDANAQTLTTHNLHQKQLINKMTKRVSFSVNEQVKETFFLNTFPYRSQKGNMQSYMIVTQLVNNTILFYDLYGESVVDPYTPGHKIHLLTLVPRVDEVIISTLGTDGVVKIVRLENSKIRVNITNELDNQNQEFVFKKYIGQADIPVEDDNKDTRGQQQQQQQQQQQMMLKERQKMLAQQRKKQQEQMDKEKEGQLKESVVDEGGKVEDNLDSKEILNQKDEVFESNTPKSTGELESLTQQEILQNKTGTSTQDIQEIEKQQQEQLKEQREQKRRDYALRIKNATLAKQNALNNTKQLQSLNSNTNNTITSQRARQVRQKKPEKFKFPIKREGKFKLQGMPNNQQDEMIQGNNISNYTSFLHQTIKGTKLFLIGDAFGSIHSFFRNGTYKGSLKISNKPVMHLLKSYPNTIFATSNQIGQLNAMTGELVGVLCEEIPDGIVEIQGDVVSNTHFYALTRKNDVFVVEIRSQDNSCRIKQKLYGHNTNINQSKELKDTQAYSMVSIKNSLLLWDLQTGMTRVFNTTHLSSETDEYFDPFTIELYKRQKNSTNNESNSTTEQLLSSQVFEQQQDQDISRLYVKGQKLSSTGSFIMIQDQASVNQTHITLYEITIPQKQDSDFINNIRGPILVVAALVFIGYQYFKKDSEEEKKQSLGDFNLKSQKNDEKKTELNKNSSLKAIESASENKQSSITQSSNTNTTSAITYGQPPIKLTPTQPRRDQRTKLTGRMHDIDDVDYRRHLYY